MRSYGISNSAFRIGVGDLVPNLYTRKIAGGIGTVFPRQHGVFQLSFAVGVSVDRVYPGSRYPLAVL